MGLVVVTFVVVVEYCLVAVVASMVAIICSAWPLRSVGSFIRCLEFPG